ncbi:MAG: polysaccharide deacetylase family protein [Candidatus Kerfeldbacteria bacterium]|nr:polysaccharide deacetylase family protein [Candidatus Kerfeldbacteria bacterium]
MRITWANFFHIYQPPQWSLQIIRKVVRESYRPLLQVLRRHPHIHITLNVSASLTEQLAHHGYRDIIRLITAAARRGQVELVGSAIYHPILPKLPSHEVLRQIERNTKVNRAYFGSIYQPRGFFFPEMAYDPRVATLTQQLGFRWFILDEIAQRGELGAIDPTFRYRHTHTGQTVIYRNKWLSDYIAFHIPLNKPNAFWDEVDHTAYTGHAFITAMDGETLGHHRPGAERLWERLVTNKRVQTVTISELIKQTPVARPTTPRRSSWSSRPEELRRRQPYILWDDATNSIHQLQWQLCSRVIALVQKSVKHPEYSKARTLLDQYCASDQWWWASAKPWWSQKIIVSKATEWVELANLLAPKQRWAQTYADHIIHTAEVWQKQNRFKRIADRYLAASPYTYVHYIGGKKITSS